MRDLVRATAEVVANLAEKAHDWATAALEPEGSARAFAGVDFVGIDFSTSIQRVASHVIRGWDRYRRQAEAVRGDWGVWAFGVNAIPFPLTRRPVPPRQLPSLYEGHFRRRGEGPGLIEYGSAFYDYFFMALDHAQRLEATERDLSGPLAITVSLLCDGLPNGGTYRAGDVRPLLEAARARGVRFKLAGFVLRKYRHAMYEFCASLGLTREELEVAWYDAGDPDELTVDSGFSSLSRY
jgi:hypothetical protein